MTTFWIVTAVLAIVVSATLGMALLRGRRPEGDAGDYDLRVYRDQLREIARDAERGVIAPEEAERLRTEVSRRILAADASAGGAAYDAGRQPARLGTVAAAVMALALIGGGYGLYLQLGAPGYGDLALADRKAAAEQARETRPTQAAAEQQSGPSTPAADTSPEYLDLVTKLRTAVQERPDDLQGQVLLARSEAALGNYVAAYEAQENIVRIKGDEATAKDYADLADMMILAAGGYVSPEAERVLEAALTRDPQNGVARADVGADRAAGCGVPPLGTALARQRAHRPLGHADPRADRGNGLSRRGAELQPATARGWPRADRTRPARSLCGRHGGGAGHEPRGPAGDDPRHGGTAVGQAGDRRRKPRGMGAVDRRLRGIGQRRPGHRHLGRRQGGLRGKRSRAGNGARRRAQRGARAVTSAAIHDDIEAFAAALPRRHALMGLDLGEKTIGVAVTDLLWSVATPVETVKRRKFTLDAERLLALLKARDVGGIVLGLPRNMDGTEGPRCQSTRAFARNFARLWDGPIGFWDERLSTVAAERALLEADTSRKRRAEVIDHVAASYILQGVLDRIRHLDSKAQV